MSEHTNPYGYDTDLYGYDEPMIGPLDAPDKPSGWHPVNISQLVMGVAFAGLLLIWALVEGNVVGAGRTTAGCCRSRGSRPARPGWSATLASRRHAE